MGGGGGNGSVAFVSFEGVVGRGKCGWFVSGRKTQMYKNTFFILISTTN